MKFCADLNQLALVRLVCAVRWIEMSTRASDCHCMAPDFNLRGDIFTTLLP